MKVHSSGLASPVINEWKLHFDRQSFRKTLGQERQEREIVVIIDGIEVMREKVDSFVWTHGVSFGGRK